MLYVVTQQNRTDFARPLREMYGDRKTVFVDRLGWRLPMVDGELEIDQFDGDFAVYLLALDDEGRHAGSLRLLPTTRPHLLSEVFPHLCERGVPRGPEIWEITRLMTRPGLADAGPVRRDLMLGVVEFALMRGVDRYTCMTHVPFLSAVLAVGWDCEPLGLPQDDDGLMVGAIAINITPETLTLVRGLTGQSQPVLNWEARHAA
jgi:N-acyl-L-homoserine lactone synthetase